METFDCNTYLSLFRLALWIKGNERNLVGCKQEKIVAQNEIGLVLKEELNDIIAHQNQIDIEKAHKIEKQVGVKISYISTGGNRSEIIKL